MLGVAKEFPNQLCNDLDKATPLHFAVLANNMETTRTLLRFGANVNSKDSFGNTPLHLAVSKGSLRMVRLLEEFGANALQKNEDGTCAIDLAVIEDHTDIKMLFMRSSKYSSFDFSG
jgi:ankyrin repeat protein